MEELQPHSSTELRQLLDKKFLLSQRESVRGVFVYRFFL